jgi:hypothetical protein
MRHHSPRQNRFTEDVLLEMRSRDLDPPRPDWLMILTWTVLIGVSLTCWGLVAWWLL